MPTPPPVPLQCLPRSSLNLKLILDSLNVEKNPKYQKRDITADGKDETFCNWFVEDACGLLDVHIPKGLRARQQIEWLSGPDGQFAGWFTCSAKDADKYASEGCAVIVTWQNPELKRSSHVAMLRSPGRITQAGSSNYSDAPLGKGFGFRTVMYVVHL